MMVSLLGGENQKKEGDAITQTEQQQKTARASDITLRSVGNGPGVISRLSVSQQELCYECALLRYPPSLFAIILLFCFFVLKLQASPPSLPPVVHTVY